MTEFSQAIGRVLDAYNTYVGTYALMALLLPVGLWFTLRLRFIQVWGLRHAKDLVMGRYDRTEDHGDVSHFQALCTALSATVGTGNIAGVALAIYYGGPGALFWLWMTGFFGMATKYAECTLAQQYREVHPDGSVSGGPMYYIERAASRVLGPAARPLAILFAVGTVLCSLGTGNMAQSNSMADAIHSFDLGDGLRVPTWLSGLVLAGLVGAVILGGIRRIASVAERLVPLMALLYVTACMAVIAFEYDRLPAMFRLVFDGAFTGTAATGGFIGSTFLLTARYGIARGLFSNEAGQGSAPIAHAAARTEFPVREGLVALMEPLVDTLIICTMTGMVLLLTGAWSSGKMGAAMSYQAFETGLDTQVLGLQVGGAVVSVSLLLFSFTTAISWSYYGDRAVGYLLGRRFVTPYRYLYCLFVLIGAVWAKEMVWKFVDAVLTLMAVPNLIALLILSPEVVQRTRDYFAMDHRPTRP